MTPSQSAGTGTPATARPEHPGFDPRLGALAGALCISASAMFVKLSGADAPTASFYRCALALPVLVPLAVREIRRLGPRDGRRLALDLAAGALLGLDFLMWVEAIASIGAGIATVLVNVQVVIVPLLALLITGERSSKGFAIAVPALLAGVALAGGVVGDQSFGADPARGMLLGTGAGVAYAGYLFLLRLGSNGRHQYSPVCAATVSAALVALVVGGSWQGIEFALGWRAFAWLAVLALAGQVLGWLLINSALPRMRSGTGSALLLLQPIGAVLFGILLLGERPSGWQLLGCGVVVLVVGMVSTRPARTPS